MNARFQVPPPPPLPTLRLKPTWENRAGRIDRSAVAEVKCSELRPFARLTPARVRSRQARTSPPAADQPNSTITPARRKSRIYREAAAHVTISARFLHQLHRRRRPRCLHGDWRTSKANAMKRHRRKQRYTPPRRRGPDLGGRLDHHRAAANPNRGATHVKKLGLFAEWKQTIRIERWRLHARLAQHFLICPTCSSRATKLFLVLCSEQENTDAMLAQTWLDTYEPYIQPHHPLADVRRQLLQRYNPILEPRIMQCRKCLKLRYGERRTQ